MQEVTIGSRRIELTSTDKVLFPENGITKGDLIDYYRRVADYILPHVEGRPVVMLRFPDGISAEGFYQQDVPDYFPDWIDRVCVNTEQQGREERVVISDEATLVYLANQACISPYVWLSRCDRLDYPDKMVFDLDPPDNGFRQAKAAAVALRGILEDDLGLAAFVMTTGSNGLHVVVPLDRSADFETVRSFAQDSAAVLADRDPELVTAERRKEARAGRVYIDTLRNSYGQASVAPYAVRARPGAPVAAPLEWGELNEVDADARCFDLCSMPSRLEKNGNMWARFWLQTCSLDEAQDLLNSLYLEVVSGAEVTGG